jgi:succinoglycan biosynthesis protein ExoM
MKDQIATVDICLCTYKRQSLLRSCLYSLLAQEGVSNINYRIVVVDNDELKSGESVVKEISSKADVEIIYASEKRRNIAHARNLCLTTSVADYICFIDDDEVASPTWLYNLYKTLCDYNADIVSGPVIATYPDATPAWVRKSRIFERPIKLTGAVVSSIGTGNCILTKSLVDRHKISFDESYGLSGGEDSKFFYELFKLGAVGVYSSEAVVYEEAAIERMSVSYFVKRALRGGQTYSSIRLIHLSKIRKAKVVMIKTLHVMVAAVLVLITLPAGRGVYIKMLIRMASSVGQIQGLSNKRIEMY